MTRISHERLKQRLHYDPETGKWTWLVKPASWIYVGDEAGGIDENGYVRLFIGGVKYRSHRLAWFYMTGEWPTDQIDHRDMDRSNNRWSNLRAATRTQNLCNCGPRKTNKCGFKGVHERKKGGFLASIQKDGKKIHIGIFSTPEEAHAAYSDKAKELHGQFARVA